MKATVSVICYKHKVLDKEIKNEKFTVSSFIDEKQDEIKTKTVEKFFILNN